MYSENMFPSLKKTIKQNISQGNNTGMESVSDESISELQPLLVYSKTTCESFFYLTGRNYFENQFI